MLSDSHSLSLSLWQTTRKKQQQQWTVVSLMRMDSSSATLSCPHWSHGGEERWSSARRDTRVHVLILLRSILIWLYIDNFSPKHPWKQSVVRVKVNTLLKLLSSVHHSAEGGHNWRHLWMYSWLLCLCAVITSNWTEGYVDTCINGYSRQIAEKWIIWFSYFNARLARSLLPSIRMPASKRKVCSMWWLLHFTQRCGFFLCPTNTL